MIRPSRLPAFLLLLACLATIPSGCASDGSDRAASDSSQYAGWVRRVESVVETMSDPDGLLGRAVEHPDSAVRREAARAIGIVAPVGAVTMLVPRLDPLEDPAVRTFAIQSLGLLHSAEALPHLLPILESDPAPANRRLAAVAMGRLEGDAVGPAAVAPLVRALGDADPGVRGAAALAIWHHGEAAEAAIDPLSRLLDAGTETVDEVRWRAAYSLGRIDSERTLAPLRARLDDPHPWVRTFAARGVRTPVDPEAVDELGALLADDASPLTARIEALLSLGAIRAGEPSRGEEVRDILLEHLMREKHPLALEVLIDGLAVDAGDVELPFILATLEGTEVATTRYACIRAIGAVAADDALDLLAEFAEDVDPWTRVATATALGSVGAGAGPLLTAMLRDEDARVRTAACESVTKIDAAFRWPLLGNVTSDPDLAVRTTAVTAFAEEKPPGWIEVLAESWRASGDPEFWELRVTVLEALAEAAGGTASLLADEGLRDPFLTVRLAAAKVLGVPPPSIDDAPPPRGLPYPRLDDPFRADPNVRATIETDRGALVLDLFLDAAPRHVSGFVAVARQGGYDGLLFHRVVPAFVVQGAGPRGDGWGDLGYHLVDEIHPVEYLRGTVGMPKAGDHTGGSQLFITHLPTPHLDGRYTVFGQVVEGLDVLDRIEVGDRIRRVTIVGSDPRRAAF